MHLECISNASRPLLPLSHTPRMKAHETIPQRGEVKQRAGDGASYRVVREKVRGRERDLGARISSSGSKINIGSQRHLSGERCQNGLPLRLQLLLASAGASVRAHAQGENHRYNGTELSLKTDEHEYWQHDRNTLQQDDDAAARVASILATISRTHAHLKSYT